MTELTFLIDLLLNHDLPKATKDCIAVRIKDVEQSLSGKWLIPEKPPYQDPIYVPPGSSLDMAIKTKQAASTLALMAKHGDAVPVPMPVMPVPEPVAVVAQNPITTAAMQSRQQAIAEALSGKVDKVTGRPKKW